MQNGNLIVSLLHIICPWCIRPVQSESGEFCTSLILLIEFIPDLLLYPIYIFQSGNFAQSSFSVIFTTARWKNFSKTKWTDVRLGKSLL